MILDLFPLVILCFCLLFFAAGWTGQFYFDPARQVSALIFGTRELTSPSLKPKLVQEWREIQLLGSAISTADPEIRNPKYNFWKAFDPTISF